MNYFDSYKDITEMNLRIILLNKFTREALRKGNASFTLGEISELISPEKNDNDLRKKIFGYDKTDFQLDCEEQQERERIEQDQLAYYNNN